MPGSLGMTYPFPYKTEDGEEFSLDNLNITNLTVSNDVSVGGNEHISGDLTVDGIITGTVVGSMMGPHFTATDPTNQYRASTGSVFAFQATATATPTFNFFNQFGSTASSTLNAGNVQADIGAVSNVNGYFALLNSVTGALNATSIGATTPGSGIFTSLSSIAGTLNASSIGATTPGSGVFTTLSSTSGTLNATSIGASTPGSGTFSSLSSTSGTLNATSIGAITPGSGAFSSLSSTSGTLNATSIGAGTPGSGAFTTLSASVSLTATIGGVTALPGTFTTLNNTTALGSVLTLATLSATGQITSSLATGTPPLVIASTTNIPNLNASFLSSHTFPSPGPIGATTPDTGTFTTITASGQITSTLATGTAPLVIASTTNIPNLNASYLGSATFAAPSPIGSTTPSTGVFSSLSSTSGTLNATSIGASTPGTGAFTTITASGQITSTLATGTAPLVIASTTNIPNLNASYLGSATFAAPSPIGSTTPSTGVFSSLSSTSGTLNATSIGATTPGTGVFTNLSATGINSTPIGAVTPSTGTFSTITSNTGIVMATGPTWGLASPQETQLRLVRTVTSAELLALNLSSTPITIIAAQGAGTLIRPLRTYITYTHGTNAYTNGANPTYSNFISAYFLGPGGVTANKNTEAWHILVWGQNGSISAPAGLNSNTEDYAWWPDTGLAYYSPVATNTLMDASLGTSNAVASPTVRPSILNTALQLGQYQRNSAGGNINNNNAAGNTGSNIISGNGTITIYMDYLLYTGLNY